MNSNYDSSTENNFLILKGELNALRLECDHSSKEQGQRIGAIEQRGQSLEDRMELLRSRIERLDAEMRVSQARLSTIWGATTGILVLVQIFRLFAI